MCEPINTSGPVFYNKTNFTASDWELTNKTDQAEEMTKEPNKLYPGHAEVKIYPLVL